MVMKVYTRKDDRTFAEMTDILNWVIKNFSNEMDPDRWTYGRDTPNPYGNELLNGPWEIEWFDFRDKKDAEWYILRWK
jgi:hypothetical protein